jgi:magnesium transporter
MTKMICTPNNSIELQALALGEKGFCATLSADGVAIRAEATGVEPFKPMLSTAAVSWVDFVMNDFGEALAIASSLGFSEQLMKSLINDKLSDYEDLETEMGIKLPAVSVSGFDVCMNPLLILIKGNMIVTLHTAEVKRFFMLRRYAETLLKKLPKKAPINDKITLLMVRIISENNSRNFDHLKDIEEQGDSLSKFLSDPRSSRTAAGTKIYNMKHALSVYLSGLWASVDALNALRYGDAELLTDNEKLIVRLEALVEEVRSQIGLAEHLSEVLASGLEVLQSIYNNQLQLLNNRLALLVAYLTIVGTAVLVPNTIATVAGNSMFGFTGGDVTWYLALIVVSTIMATVLSWWAVKRMGLLPSGPEE